MAVINGVALGAGQGGLSKLNDVAAVSTVTHTFTLATSDFGENNIKRVRFIYVELTADVSPEVRFTIDGVLGVRAYTVELKKNGLQRIKVPVGRDEQGSLWSIRFFSTEPFRVNKIEALLYTRSKGIRG